jgi:hypothetical protein
MLIVSFLLLFIFLTNLLTFFGQLHAFLFLFLFHPEFSFANCILSFSLLTYCVNLLFFHQFLLVLGPTTIFIFVLQLNFLLNVVFFDVTITGFLKNLFKEPSIFIFEIFLLRKNHQLYQYLL